MGRRQNYTMPRKKLSIGTNTYGPGWEAVLGRLGWVKDPTKSRCCLGRWNRLLFCCRWLRQAL